jgi:steroid 5-alpha reductase family enzyme
MIAVLISAQILTHLFFLYAQKITNWGVIDIAWGLGFVIIGFTSLLIFENFHLTSWLVFAMVNAWGLRLAIFLFKRNHGKAEDWRYAKFRNEWAPYSTLNAYFKIFVFQGLLMFLISLPQIVFWSSKQTIHFNVFTLLGFLLWVIGMTFEIVSDHQLARFKKEPTNKGKLMQSGLWRYSRHPNYFGEVTLWWGLWLMLLPFNPWWTILGPLLISFFIVNVTGLPLLEERYKGREDFIIYKNKTNIFFPWFPKKD